MKAPLARDLTVSASVLVIAVCAPWSATAQPTAAASAVPEQLEQIIVTARKREEAAQSVPIAITVLSKKDLVNAQITTIADLQKQTPSLNIRQDAYSPFGAQIGLRGQRQSDTLLSQQPAVGVYIDGVYNANTQALGVANFWDVERVETLKGPQGTLFGRNTTGGAISITTAAPNYDGTSGDLRAGAGNFHSYELDGALNAPIVADKVALRVAVQYLKHGGYARDLQNHQPLMDMEDVTTRLALRLDPTENLRVTLRADYSDGKSGGANRKLVYLQPGSVAAIDAAVAYHQFTAIPFPPFVAPNAAAGGAMLLANIPTDPYRERDSIAQSARSKTHGFSATVDYSLTPEIDLKSVTGYREGDLLGTQDSDGSPVRLLDSPVTARYLNQWSQEFDVNGSSLSKKLNWTTGLYYYYLSGKDSGYFIALSDLTGGRQVPQFTKVQSYSGAAFGQATYAITDKLNVTGGVRWTTELQRAQNFVGCPAPNAFYCSYKTSAKNWSYTGDVDYHIDADKLVYFRTARGFKGGGINERGIGTFAPEVVTDYEVGTKSDFFDRRLRVNADYYHSKYSQIQRTIIVPLAGGGVSSIIVNAASAKIDGVEVAVNAIPVKGLTLGVSGDYLKAKYQRYVNGLGQDLSAHKFDAPKWQYTLNAAYVVPTALGDLRGGLSYAWQSSIDYQPDNHLSAASVPFTTQKSYGLLDGRLSLNMQPQNLEVAFWVKNITDKVYLVGALDVTGAGLGFVDAIYGAPRTWGVEVTKHF